MKERPRSRYEDESGVCLLNGCPDLEPEYPEVIAWDKGYADECDRLSHLAISKTGYQHWGRWYLNTNKPVRLDTRIIIPSIGKKRRWHAGVYSIELSRIGVNGGVDGSKYTWQQHMTEKNWLGKKGLRDLGRAITALQTSSGGAIFLHNWGCFATYCKFQPRNRGAL